MRRFPLLLLYPILLPLFTAWDVFAQQEKPATDTSGATRAAPPPPLKVEWKPVFYKNRLYVSVGQVASYYDLTAPKSPGKEIALTGGKIRINLTRGEKRMRLNDWTFYFSFPVVTIKDEAMVSVFDVRNVLDPILRPHELREPAILQTVVLDPAGGGAETGVKGGGITEQELTLEIARLLRPLLTATGFRVVLTREKDEAVSTAQRVKTANDVPEEGIYIRLAAGSGPASMKGFECSTLPPAGTPATHESDSIDIDKRFYPGNIGDRESLALAATLQSSTVTGVKAVDLGVRRVRLDELRDVHLPAVICRLGCLTHKDEAKKLADPHYRKLLADSLAAGVQRYAAYLRKGIEERAAADQKRPLRFGKIFMEQPVDEMKRDEQVRLRVPVLPAAGVNIDRSLVEMQVFLFESVDGRELDLSTADPPAVEWLSILPDWRDGQAEWMQITYQRPPFTAAEIKQYGRRTTYGYVARLIYDGRVMDEAAEPVNLNRALYYFTPVFPKR